MGNVLETIGHDIKVGAEDVGKAVVKAVEYAIVDPVEFTAKTIAVLETAEKDAPEVKSAFEGLISQVNTVAGAAGTEIAAGGTNLPEYVTIFQAVQSLISFVKGTLVPVVESAYSDEKAAVNTTTATS